MRGWRRQHHKSGIIPITTPTTTTGACIETRRVEAPKLHKLAAPSCNPAAPSPSCKTRSLTSIHLHKPHHLCLTCCPSWPLRQQRATPQALLPLCFVAPSSQPTSPSIPFAVQASRPSYSLPPSSLTPWGLKPDPQPTPGPLPQQPAAAAAPSFPIKMETDSAWWSTQPLAPSQRQDFLLAGVGASRGAAAAAADKTTAFLIPLVAGSGALPAAANLASMYEVPRCASAPVPAPPLSYPFCNRPTCPSLLQRSSVGGANGLALPAGAAAPHAGPGGGHARTPTHHVMEPTVEEDWMGCLFAAMGGGNDEDQVLGLGLGEGETGAGDEWGGMMGGAPGGANGGMMDAFGG